MVLTCMTWIRRREYAAVNGSRCSCTAADMVTLVGSSIRIILVATVTGSDAFLMNKTAEQAGVTSWL